MKKITLILILLISPVIGYWMYPLFFSIMTHLPIDYQIYESDANPTATIVLLILSYIVSFMLLIFIFKDKQKYQLEESNIFIGLLFMLALTLLYASLPAVIIVFLVLLAVWIIPQFF